MIMPTVQPHAPGCIGTAHGKDYFINDPEAACVASAKWQAVMLDLLLGNGAERAKKIKSEFVPVFASKDEYLAYVDSLITEGDRIEYRSTEAIIRL